MENEICRCKVVTEEEITEAIRSGARSVQAVCEATGASGGCGRCIPLIEYLIKKTTGQAAKNETV